MHPADGDAVRRGAAARGGEIQAAAAKIANHSRSTSVNATRAMHTHAMQYGSEAAGGDFAAERETVEITIAPRVHQTSHPRSARACIV